MKPITKQELARIRNWNKARLCGITIDRRGLTSTEMAIFENAMNSIRTILKIYDRGYGELGLNSDPPRYDIILNKTLWRQNISYNETKVYRELKKQGEEDVQIIRNNPKRKKDV